MPDAHLSMKIGVWFNLRRPRGLLDLTARGRQIGLWLAFSRAYAIALVEHVISYRSKEHQSTIPCDEEGGVQDR